MTVILNASTTQGLVLTSDTSGNVVIQSNGTNAITTAGANVTIAGTVTVTGGVTVGANASPAFIATSNVGQSLASNTWTKVQFNIESYDTANCYDNVTNYRFTPNVAGYYQTNAIVETNASSKTAVAIYKNGSMYREVWVSNPAIGSTPAIACLVYMNGSTDYIEAWINVNNASNLYTAVVDYEFSAFLARSA